MTTITKPWDDIADRNVVLRFIDTNLKGSGQVMFQGNALTGLLFLIGIFWGAIAADTITVAIGAVVGLVVSTVTGMLLHSDDDSMRIGLYGYNGILVGAAFPTFLAGGVMLWIYLVVGAAASTIAFLAVANVFKTWGVPALTFPFNLVNWFFLLAAFQFLRIETSDLSAAQFPQHIGDSSVHADITFGFLWDTLFRNVSQIFLINNTVTGIIFVVALLVASRWAAVFALIGSAVAIGSVLALGANTVDVGNGLYGLSSVLTAIALGSVFYNPSWRVFVYTVFGVLVTVVIHGTLVSAFAPISLPAGTGPFVFATWLFLLPKKKFVPVQHDTIKGGAAEGKDSIAKANG
ncbi:urea transporter [Rhodococcus sp. WS3]|uniref:urea transporter n=1 Tax=unclassified Rhodococcus (in: high G+C Gram-positive bacteria) TaxID=192944 RepID=UPI001144018E|nr:MULTISPECIES: urea transporter [unclassified Rhodococcus (in: high G+C Gram-positive bacteria)]ROZ50696.1 urea transporter [Rhodococcus sp. WS3]RZL26777.1 MAG: urea transporter [Rhodococcus sp. (in: high G+C Gram-positive bacteria)]